MYKRQALDDVICAFRDRPIEKYYPFLITDATYFKVRSEHRITSRAFMVSMGITEEGMKEIVGFGVYDNESKATWLSFYESLKKRGLQSPKMIISDAHQGEKAAIGIVYPGSPWQRCQVHFRRNIAERVPKKYMAGIGLSLIHISTHLLHAGKIVFNDCREDGVLSYLNGREITCPPSEMFIRIKEDIFGKINFWRQ